MVYAFAGRGIMKYSIIGFVLVLMVAAGAFVLFDDRGDDVPVEAANGKGHALIVELVAPVSMKTAKSRTGDPVVATTKMVSVKVTLQFAKEDARDKASGRTRQLRRIYANPIGLYLSNREETATDDIEAKIREHVAKATLEMFGAGVVTDFEIEGQFGEPAAEQ